MNNESVYTLQELARAFSELPIPMFLIMPADPRHRGPQDPDVGATRNTLMQLASETGGYASAVSNKQEMLAVATQLASAIRSLYTLYYAAPGRKAGQVDDLRIEVKGVDPRPVPLYRTIAYAQ